MTPIPEHAELNEQLSAYLDGALDDVTRRRLTAHLAACAICRLDLAQLGETQAALRALPTLRAPRSFAISAELASELALPVAAGPPDGRARRTNPLRPAMAPWLVWTGRLGSFAAAACLLLAVITAALPVTFSSGVAGKALAPAAPAAASFDRSEAAGTAVAGVAPSSAFAPASGAAAGSAPGAASGAASGAAPGAAPGPPAPVADANASQRVASQAQAPRSAPVERTSVPQIESGGGVPAPAARPAPGLWMPGLWVALGAILALPSAALLFLERWARRRA